MRTKVISLIFILICSMTLTQPTFAKRNVGGMVDDALISSKLRYKFMKDSLVASKDISIRVLDGVVTLRGEADTQDQINHAIEICEQQDGVKEVKAYLVLREFGQLRQEPEQKKRGFLGLFTRSHLDSPPKPDDQKGELQEKDLGSDDLNAVSATAPTKPEVPTTTASVPTETIGAEAPKDPPAKAASATDSPEPSTLSPTRTETPVKTTRAEEAPDDYKEFEGN